MAILCLSRLWWTGDNNCRIGYYIIDGAIVLEKQNGQKDWEEKSHGEILHKGSWKWSVKK